MKNHKTIGILMLNIILFFSFSTLLFSQKEEILKVDSFNAIEIIGRIDVDLVSSKEEKLNISYEGIDRDKISITNQDNVLKIKIISTLNYKDIRVQIQIFYKDLKKIGAYSSAGISSNETLVFDNINFESESGGDIALHLFADTIISKCSTKGILTLKGHAKSHNIKISSGSILSAYELDCDNYDVNIITKGIAKIKVKNFLTGKVNSGGSLFYNGNPVVQSLDSTLGGKIEKVNL